MGIANKVMIYLMKYQKKGFLMNDISRNNVDNSKKELSMHFLVHIFSSFNVRCHGNAFNMRLNSI